MKEVISLLLVSPFLIYFAFQPLFNHVVHLQNSVLEIVIDQGIEKAAVDGRFTSDNIQQMKRTVADVLHFSESEIVFEGTQTQTPRGEYIWGRISIPPGQMSVMPGLFGSRPVTLSASAKQMSEYIPK